MTTASPSARAEIVFVFDNLADWQQLADAAAPEAEVVVLDGTRDGLAQMAEELQGRSGVDAVHILSHGDVGKVQLGNRWLDASNIATHQVQLATIGSALSDSGDILLYGCRVAEDETGIGFVRSMAEATGADVSASNDLTGSPEKYGDWALETNIGDIESVPLEFGAGMECWPLSSKISVRTPLAALLLLVSLNPLQASHTHLLSRAMATAET